MADRIQRSPDHGKPPRWGRLYGRHFPDDTDGASRHVKCFAEQLRGLNNPVRALVSEYQEPDHIARSMEITVIALWRARAENRRLKAQLDDAPAPEEA